MNGLGFDMLIVLRGTARIVLGRWRLFLLLAGALTAANLVQAFVAAAGTAHASALTWAMTMLFLVGRLAVLVVLHIAGVRLAAAPALPARRVAALEPRQALWFHALILIWIVGLGFRYGVGAPLMAVMTRGGVPPLLADLAVTASYLLLLFVLFVRLQPAFVGIMLGDPETTIRWSIRRSRGYAWRTFVIAAVLGTPPLLVRQTLAHALAGWTLAGAVMDGVLSAVMMLLPSVTYYRIYQRIRHDLPRREVQASGAAPT